MKRPTLLGVACVSMVVSLFPAVAARSATTSAKLSPVVAAIVAAMAHDDVATVIVHMTGGANLETVPGSGTAKGSSGVIHALQHSASRDQAAIRAYLRSRKGDGAVSAFTSLWVIDGLSVTATGATIRELATRKDVASITADELPIVPDTAPADSGIAAVHAPEMWDRGSTGQGAVVATLDSGVDMAHPDLSGRWRGGTNSWFDPYGQHPATPTDLTGHGTATMGVVLGGDAGGTSIGMAPGATWIAAKIFNDSGGATATAIHQAFQWVLDPDHDPSTRDGAQVVNGSWSIGSGPGCDLSFQPDLQALRAAGVLPVFAAGNFGPGASTSVSPANYPEAFAVGAVDSARVPAFDSSRGPSTCGGRTRSFPDVVAPGVDVRTADRFGMYQTVSGTSVAAPHAAGALALLLSVRPGLTADQQATALRAGSTDLGVAGPDDTTGAGLLNVDAAYDQLPPPNTDTAPPTITISAPAAPPGQSGYFAAAQVPVTVTVTATDDAGVASVTCVDGTSTLVPSPQPVGSPISTAGTFSITADGTHAISCVGTDGLGNGPGAALGSQNAVTIRIDNTAPVVGGVAVLPNPTNTTTSSSTTVAGSALGTDPTSGVTRAEWFEGADPGAGNGVAMGASDGAFGGSAEGLMATIDYVARGWRAGSHTVSMRVRDAAGNWSLPASTAVGIVLPNALFADGFESGGFGGWSATGGTAGRIAVTTTGAEGAYKMTASISSGTSGYTEDRGPLADAEYHARFLVQPNSYTTGSGGNPSAIDLFRGLNGSGATLLQVQYRRSTNIGAQVRLVVTRSGGTTATGWFALTSSAWNAVEIDWASGSSTSAHLYTGGVLRGTLSGLATSASTLEAVRLGPQGSLPKTTGSMSFDSFSSTRRTVI